MPENNNTLIDPQISNRILWRPDEVAEFFGVTTRTIYNWYEIGYLEGIKTPRALRIFRRSIVKRLRNEQGLSTE